MLWSLVTQSGIKQDRIRSNLPISDGDKDLPKFIIFINYSFEINLMNYDSSKTAKK